MKKFLYLSFENKLWQKGFKVVAGMDEVGRGSFSGPLVAACVAFPDKIILPNKEILIDDSKKLTFKQREISTKWIKKNALAYGIGQISPSLINKVGMAKASKMVFRKAVYDASKKLGSKVNFLLIDAFYVPYIRGVRRKYQKAIINGDEKCFSIAAASILAKVYRDKFMQKLGMNPKYKNYGWERNKGYGTKEHQNAILKYGLTKYHRKQFVANLLA